MPDQDDTTATPTTPAAAQGAGGWRLWRVENTVQPGTWVIASTADMALDYALSCGYSTDEVSTATDQTDALADDDLRTLLAGADRPQQAVHAVGGTWKLIDLVAPRAAAPRGTGYAGYAGRPLRYQREDMSQWGADLMPEGYDGPTVVIACGTIEQPVRVYRTRSEAVAALAAVGVTLAARQNIAPVAGILDGDLSDGDDSDASDDGGSDNGQAASLVTLLWGPGGYYYGGCGEVDTITLKPFDFDVALTNGWDLD